MNIAYVATAGLEAAPLQDGAVLYNLKTSKFIMLNRSAAFLWSELATPKSDDDLVSRLRENFSEIPIAVARQGVSEALGQLKDLDLVSEKSGSTESPAPVPKGGAEAPKNAPIAYERPTVRVLDEDELLNIFQMTAAEISVASCWWGACTAGCP